ncbi:hypothetical protein C8Q78DRAFT_1154828 [Trametes maxima]|nr:hypothetical protein C8Q78DRAFT_1154828 [Trametes maxima]
MSDLGYNVWGVIAGVIGTVALIPVFIAWFNTRLPSARITPLVELLREVEELFSAALREGLFTSQEDLHQFSLGPQHLARIDVDEARGKAYSASAWKQDVKNWWNGLSDDISAVQAELNTTRVKLANRNSNERKRRASQHSVGEAFDPPAHIGKELTLPSRNTISSAGLLGGQLICPPKDGCASIDLPLNHHLISDVNLQGLLSLALAGTSTKSGGKRHRATRHRLLLRFGRELYGSQASSATGALPDSAPYRPSARQPRFKAVTHLLRPDYGEQVKDAYPSPWRMHVSESQCTRQAGGGDDEAGEWQDER